MWTLSAFADEISPELDVQLATLAAEEIRYVEFRGVWNKNVLDLSDAEMRAAGRHRSPKGLPRYAKRTMKQVEAGAKKRRATRTKADNLSE